MNRRARISLAVALAFMPGIIPLLLIYFYGTNLPYWDEWDPGIAGLYIKAHVGELHLLDFAAQHNEHRILVPRLLFFVLNTLTHWNAYAEMVFQWLIVCLTSLMILLLQAITASPSQETSLWHKFSAIRGSSLAAWFLCNLLLFTPAQAENWLWGMGIANVLPAFFVCAAILSVCVGLPKWQEITFATVFCSLATYSSGNGLLAWPLVAMPMAWSSSVKELKSKKWTLAIFAAAAAINLILYFIGYVKPTHDGKHPYATGVVPVIQYIVVFLGGFTAFSARYPADTLAAIVGSVELILLLGAVFYFLYRWIIRREFDVGLRILPILCLAGFPVLSALLAGAARASLGLNQALSSRYVTFSLYLPVALIMLVPLVVQDILPRLAAKGQTFWARLLDRIPTALATALSLLWLLSIPAALEYCGQARFAHRQGKAATLLINFFPTNPLIAQVIYPRPEVAISQAKTLSEMGYFHPPLITSNEIPKLQSNGGADPARIAGALEQVENAPQGLVVAKGWAVFPEKKLPADLVLLSYDNVNGLPVMFAIESTRFDRQELESSNGIDTSSHAGWQVIFAGSMLPPAPQNLVIRAWALDSDDAAQLPLTGSVTIKR